MAGQLKHEDGRAVDLLLDHDTAAAGSVNMSSPTVGARMQSVERVLKLLEAMPAVEPPLDLVGRTLQRIEEASVSGGGRSDASQPAVQPPISSARPQA
jgi:hypothetical protein